MFAFFDLSVFPLLNVQVRFVDENDEEVRRRRMEGIRERCLNVWRSSKIAGSTDSVSEIRSSPNDFVLVHHNASAESASISEISSSDRNGTPDSLDSLSLIKE
ncbi:hypothetical protein AB6A40_009031 [Gnathostoma spinigerum]|uniref:Uncharacterized protein n=1 Tax=Gnathostoma spinigerum TaxID=75299 RepID=A0ABD6EZT7_9BILA